MYDANKIKYLITDQLESAGWVTIGDSRTYAVATKDFETAVGTKTAIACFLPLNETETIAKLSGEYCSEGRNILSTASFLMEPDMTAAEIRSGADVFIAQVDAAAYHSYAVKVLRAS